MTARTVRIVNPLGLHARAAARFVRAAGAYRAEIRVANGRHTMDGKSIMGLLLLAATPGTELTISADGPDEVEAVETLCRLVAAGFEP
jgi:phosphocarrier protein HPr